MRHTVSATPEYAATLNDNEKARLIAGRYDWMEWDWQDHCGDEACPWCEGNIIPEGRPNALSKDEQELRAYLISAQDPSGVPADPTLSHVGGIG